MTTTQIKHTPAPWKHDDTWGLIMHGQTQICALHSGIKANARLIAAAPELLSYLKDAAFQLERLHGDNLAIYAKTFAVLASNAIAKAEGRTE